MMPRKPASTYKGAHTRVRRERGSARGFACLDCGEQATQWAYRHGSDGEQRDPQGRVFSLDPQHFDPLCVLCHQRRDAAARRRDVSPLEGSE